MKIFGRESANAGIDQRSAQAGRRLRLLVVDENPTALAVMGRRLTHTGHDVVLADNGFVAINLLQAQRFDLILIDMMMRLLPGPETMKKMRASGLLGAASIMLVTGRNAVPLAVEALSHGADDYVVKPFDFDILDARIRHVVAKAEEMQKLIHHNGMLDARIARRAVELGEARAELEDLRLDRARLIASIQALHDELQQLGGHRQG